MCEQEESGYKKVLAEPLIKSMYIRDSSRFQFDMIKYDPILLRTNPEYKAEASKGIKYDEFLKPKPEFLDKMMKELELYK